MSIVLTKKYYNSKNGFKIIIIILKIIVNILKIKIKVNQWLLLL